jgi:hypothetical protein
VGVQKMSRDIPKYIPANGVTVIPLAMDTFVYLKESPVDVYVSTDQERLEMQQGDKLVFEVPAKEMVIENPTNNRIRVVVTVGKGDYDRLHVSGEL